MNPTETTWLTPLFGLSVIPGAHDTLGNIFSVNADGEPSSFLSANHQLDRMAGDALSALSIPSEREFTDDKLIRLCRLVGAASAVHLPFHADERVMAEPGGVVVCAARSTTAASQRFQCEG